MENTPENNLISNACAVISSGKTFGGWTDLMDAYGYFSKNQIRTKGRRDRQKMNFLDKQKRSRERFKLDSTKRMASAKMRDIRQDPKDTLRQR